MILKDNHVIADIARTLGGTISIDMGTQLASRLVTDLKSAYYATGCVSVGASNWEVVLSVGTHTNKPSVEESFVVQNGLHVIDDTSPWFQFGSFCQH